MSICSQIIASDDDNQPPSGTSGSVEVKEGAAEPGNEGTMMLDATSCSVKHKIPTGLFPSERGKGKTGKHHRPFFKKLWIQET